MRILFALPYGPTETRVRSRSLLEQLAKRHDIVLLGLVWNADDRRALDEWRSAGLEVYQIGHDLLGRLRGLAGNPRRPLQQMISVSPPFARAARELVAGAAATGRPFDAIHVEHLRGAAAIDLTAGLPVRSVFDAVDCIAELARRTAQHGSGALTRRVASIEQARTARYEAALLDSADVVTVVADRDRTALCGNSACDHVQVIPNGVHALPRPIELTSRPVAVFTGKLAYHANQAAVRTLFDQLWPRIHARVPDARLIVAGAAPPEWMRRRDGASGISIVADPPDMFEVIAGARVALAPVVYSVGIQNKVLEAMACGVPVVASREATAGLAWSEPLAPLRALNDIEFVESAVRLLRDTAWAREAGERGHALVTQRYSWEAAAAAFERLCAGASATEMVA